MNDRWKGNGLLRDFFSACKKRGKARKIADSMGQELTGTELLLRTLILRRLLHREVLADDESYVGVLLPPSSAGVMANVALALDHRVSVNLNYAANSDVVNYCIQDAGLRHVLSSRRVMSKLDLKLDIEPTYLEDLKDKVNWTDKLAGAMGAYVLPAGVLAGMHGVDRVADDDLITIIFTSGSTGLPKGVMLTYQNVRHNTQAINEVVHLNSSDTLIGILPFFHSFGYTVTIWAVMTIDIAGAYHFSPLDAKGVGRLAEKYNGTILVTTPTFLRSFLRRCPPEQFKALEVVVTGAERLPPSIADAFAAKFGVLPVEGYGTTELSPLVAVNIPPSRARGDEQGLKPGTVGRCVPGVQAKLTDPDTGQDIADGQGMLMVKGLNVMKGYLGKPELTAQAIRDGWYKTGDLATIDDEGFITITGRESRFSKIGGEMVPHMRVEDELAAIIARPDSQDQELRAVVTSVPDERKGERLIVVHMPLEQTPDQLCRALADAGLPNLFIPTPDSFMCVDVLPILGTGKLDLKAVQKLAAERFAAANNEPRE